MNKIIVIVGPTAVGKTKLSIELAKKLNGEIINADSMQVYKGLDVGTAKISEEEMQGVKHHLLDIKEVTENYSVYDYQKDCREKITYIQSKGLVPIIVGGTGLYVKAALYDYEFNDEKPLDLNSFSNKELYDEIIAAGGNVDFNNRRRLERAYIRIRQNNCQPTNKNKLLYDAIFIGMTTDRERLYNMINERVDNMVDALIEEVKYFYNQKIHSKSLQTGIGYKEFYEYFDGKITLEEAISKIKQHSRNYAKKQYTWFNNQMNIKWFNVNYDDFSKTESEIINYIDKVQK